MSDHPKHHDRYQCTPEHPYNPELGGKWVHREAYEVADSQRDGWPAGDTVRVKCDTCGLEWTEELPQ